MTNRTHKSASCPTIELYCDDPAHAEKPWTIATFAKIPAGRWLGVGEISSERWVLLSGWFGDTFRQEDLVVYFDPVTMRRLTGPRAGALASYSFECFRCVKLKKRVTVEASDESVQLILDGLGCNSITLTELADRIGNSVAD
jgi:hypothetical protein